MMGFIRCIINFRRRWSFTEVSSSSSKTVALSDISSKLRHVNLSSFRSKIDCLWRTQWYQKCKNKMNISQLNDIILVRYLEKWNWIWTLCYCWYTYCLLREACVQQRTFITTKVFWLCNSWKKHILWLFSSKSAHLRTKRI